MAAEFAAPTEAATWVVNTLEDPTEWDTADDVVSLREAIGSAQAGDTIVFDDGLAGGTITLSRSYLGVYRGITIDASAVGGITIDANGQSRVFYINGGSAENPVELISLTITGGNEYYGGGIYCYNSTLALTNSTVLGNTANDYGGGIYCYNSTLSLTDSTVSGNTANSGGGIYNNYSTLTVTGSIISENIATDDYGGGIYNNDNSTLSLTDSTVSGNTANSGGGIYNYCSTLTVTGSIISENIATNDVGGGIYCYDNSTLSLTDSTVSGNTANSGGGIYCYNSTLSLTDSTVSGNTANSGGGIYNESGTLTLTNSTISGNTTNYSGGGIYNCYNSTLSLADSTVSGNTANEYGGGIYNKSGTLTITNTILSLNCANSNSDFYSDRSFSSSHNIIGLDPGFVVAPVFEDGKLINADELNLSLTAESIAIDRGLNDAVETETDVAGNPRIVAAWRETPTVDIGAYEYQGRVEQEDIPLTVVTTDLDIIDEADGLISLREAILYAAITDEAVTFDESLAGKTIFLDGTQLEINTAVTIDATSIGGITVDAYDQSRVFYIAAGDETDPVRLIGLTITGGWAEGDGGGIYVANSGNLTLTGSTVTRNTATSYGGGIYNRGELTVMDSTIAENTATNYGGGIYNQSSGKVTINNSAFTGNTANQGGGIFNNDSGKLTVTNSAISGNTANSAGGIYNNGTLTMTDCTVSGNTANDTGAGILNYRTLMITNCIVSENAVGDSYWARGGGIYNSGTLAVTDSTITGNTASGYGASGGGIYSVGTLTLTNSILSLNYANWDNDIYNYSNPVTGSNNIIGLNPGFVIAPVFENGRLVNADELDLSLTAVSVAIDGGTNAAVETETDFAGNPRIVAAWRETPTVDIGAYEYQGTVTRGEIETPSTVVTTVLDILDETDGLISLREAILYAAAGDTVTFDPSLASRTIVLDGAELVIDKNLSIDASAVCGITIDGNGKCRIFTLRNASGRVTVNLAALAIRSGRAYYGGGIYNDGTILTLTNCTVTKSYAYYGGGIYNTNSGTLTAANTTVTDNSAYYWDNGHALYTSGGTVTFYNSIITGSVSVSSTRTYAYNTLSSDFTNWTRSQNCPTYDYYKPLFADPSHNDYTLAENSQAINAGNNTYVTTETDLAGNPRILNGTVDLGAYEYTGLIEPLDAPSILTGSNGCYVSYGANRHQVTWSAVDRAVSYEFAYSEDGGSTWTSLETNDTSAVVRGLTYGTEVAYRVRALSTRYLENSEWSAEKAFNVCPMDVNNDGDISNADRTLLAIAWLSEKGDDTYLDAADIDGDGNVANSDRAVLSANWLMDADDDNLLYPRPRAAADIVFAEYESADIGIDLAVF